MKYTTLVLSYIMLCTTHYSFAQDKTEDKIEDIGKNVYAIAPISFSEVSKGVGISYEHMLDTKGIVSLWVPVMFGFRTYNDYLYNNQQNNSATVYGHFYAMPGIKIYPTGNDGKVKYSIGPNLIYATGQMPQGYTPLSSEGPTVNFMKLGIMVNGSLNLNPLKHLYLGLDLGFGITYLNQQDGVTQNTGGLVHFAFRIGYRN